MAKAEESTLVHPIAKTHELRVLAFHLWLEEAPGLREALIEAGSPWSDTTRARLTPPSWQEIQTWATFESRRRPPNLRPVDDLAGYRDKIADVVQATGLRPPEGVTEVDFCAYSFAHQTGCWLARHRDLNLPPVLVHKDAFLASGPDEELASVFAAAADTISPDNLHRVVKGLKREARAALGRRGYRKRERTPDYDRQLRLLFGRLNRGRSLYELGEEHDMTPQATSRDVRGLAARIGLDPGPP
jgi:hypothetical protein